MHIHYFILCTFRFPNDTMMPCACACLNIDMIRGVISIPSRKRKRFKKDIGKLVTKSHISLWSASSILEKVRSVLACFPGLRLLTDYLVAIVQHGHKIDYDCVLPITSRAHEQARLCASFLGSWQGRPMCGTPSNKYIAVDTSDFDLRTLHLSNPSGQVHRFIDPHLHIIQK